jgi:ABC-2 type transport system ATP-binding protein
VDSTRSGTLAAPAVHFEDAGKDYGETRALRGLTLSVAPGTLFALVGPNGAGKTTTIGLLTGLLTPTGGRVRVFGADVAADPIAAKRRIGFVPDRPYVFPRWTPRETLRFIGAIFGMSGWSLEGAIASELESFGIADVADAPNDTLSHGTKQKVALAQAFLHRPELLVLDEPMVGLDPLAQRRLVERLRERTSEGAAVFFTTHQLALAEDVADVCGLLHQGRLAALGTPSELAGGASLAETFFRLTGA